MSIKLDENYTIEKDTASWNLVMRKQTGFNEEKQKPIISHSISYHATIRQALRQYCDENFGQAQSVAKVLELIDKLNAKIDALDESALRALNG